MVPTQTVWAEQPGRHCDGPWGPAESKANAPRPGDKTPPTLTRATHRVRRPVGRRSDGASAPPAARPPTYPGRVSDTPAPAPGAVLVRVGGVVFLLGAVSTLATVAPLFLGTEPLPPVAWFLSMLMGVGFLLAAAGVLRSVAAERRQVTAEQRREDTAAQRRQARSSAVGRAGGSSSATSATGPSPGSPAAPRPDAGDPPAV